ncbi:SDR family oxidoreductase [Frankia sp. AiPs1]|uniref:SDR family NAD(P)-dependent oxidoreductase n=1 Tax=Frankia sp. AiPs1 TaxID=573493 RepID=UPI002043D359|nr:SDR family oxidoreductase [Frankia sp. AiPs1]MCM3926220.1 SDR family oxidoreductase [Frankia sp. AiPs1]
MTAQADLKMSTALVTGASSGIGAAFAQAYAARGATLVLVAPAESRLKEVAQRLGNRYGVEVHAVPIDLAEESGPDQLAKAVAETGLEIDILVNNAGFGTRGPYHELSADRDHREVMVNVVAVERVAHLFLPTMVARGSGTIINVSSTSGFQAVPYMAVYGASKAFVLSFSIGLWAECRPRGVRVLALCPGPTDTDFFEVLGSRMSAGGRLRTTDEVVAAAFRALDRGQAYVIDGRLNYLTSNASRLLPRGLVARITERVLRSGSLAALPGGSPTKRRVA